MPYEGSKVMPEEPYALIGHVRDCGGPGGQPLGLPGSRPGRMVSFLSALPVAGRLNFCWQKVKMMNPHDKRYDRSDYYWGVKPSPMCFEVLKLMPPDRPLKLLDIGCGEGRNAVFFARNGYEVSAFDLSAKGIEKTLALAERARVEVRAFQADLTDYRIEEDYDILFSTGVLHYIPAASRTEIMENYKRVTTPDGLNVFSVVVHKPFIPPAPDVEQHACFWISGELFTHYHDWRIEYCTEEIFDDVSSGIPHQHAMDRVIARKTKA